MIFVTVGTHYQPFQRLLDALEALDGEELVVQYGAGAAPAGAARAEAFMPFDEMIECFRGAEKVITHAGVGSILCAIREGHLPLVVPRRHDLGEHLDEHQAELARALEGRGSAVGVWDAAHLPELVADLPARGKRTVAPDQSLLDGVSGALCGGHRLYPVEEPSGRFQMQ